MATNTDILEKIGEVSVSVARVEQRVIRLDEISADLTKAIKGNGKPGLLDRVTVIENCHANEDKVKIDNKAKKEKIDGRTWAVIMVIITQLVLIGKSFLFP